MWLTKSSPPLSCIRIALTLIVSMVLCLSSPTLFAQESKVRPPVPHPRAPRSEVHPLRQTNLRQPSRMSLATPSDRWVRPLRQANLRRSPPATITQQENSSTNVIAVLKITEIDNDVNVSRTKSTELPEELSVQGNYPNPFRTETRIVFNLPEQAQVYAEVFDLLGRVVYTSQTQQMGAGWDHVLSLDLSQTSSGLYIYRVHMETASGTISRTGRIIQVR